MSVPQEIMDIFGWLSHNGELQLIINAFNTFVLVEETLLTLKIHIYFSSFPYLRQ